MYRAATLHTVTVTDSLRQTEGQTADRLTDNSIMIIAVHAACSTIDLNSLTTTVTVRFLARDSIYAIARYMPSPVRLSVRLAVRPSVCLSVRHTGGSVKDG